MSDPQTRSNDPTTTPNEPGVAAILRTINDSLGKAEQGLLLFFLVVLVLVGAFAAGSSFFTEHRGVWAGELIKYSVFFIAMAGAALAAAQRQMISMDVVCRFLPETGQAWIRVATSIFGAVMCIILLYRGLDVFDVVAAEHKEFEFIRPDYGSLALPIGCGLIATHMVLHALIDLAYLLTGSVAPKGQHLKAH